MSFLVRDIMYRKPAKARPMVEKCLALSKLMSKDDARSTSSKADDMSRRRRFRPTSPRPVGINQPPFDISP